ncbi:MAG: hypothetical protein COA78_16595 [Blastopirellula sp.]|nr:MAG: hypothetical protein COA78_16595 [Blastopirellula sp.]
MSEVEYEQEFIAYSINDETKDYYLRLSRFIPEFNVIQLKEMEDDQKSICLGLQTDTINVHAFMLRAKEHNLEITLKLV